MEYGHLSTKLQNLEMEIFVFYDVTVDSILQWTHWARQNDLIFVKYF